jgi:hypothetical protein
MIKKVYSKARWFYTTFRPEKMNQDSIITNEMKQLLLGTMLGDGCIGLYPKYKNARFSMRHSIVQRHWFFYKAKKLISLTTPKAIHVQKPDGFSKRCKLHFQTTVHSELTKMYQQMYVNNVKTVNSSWLDELTPYGLMVMYLDDGGLTGKGNRKILLSVQNFQQDGVEILQNYFETKWDISTTIQTYYTNAQGVPYAQLIFSQNNAKKFLRLIMKFIPTEHMIYKVCLKYDDPVLQQHWISELKIALSHFSQKIDALYLELRK